MTSVYLSQSYRFLGRNPVSARNRVSGLYLIVWRELQSCNSHAWVERLPCDGRGFRQGAQSPLRENKRVLGTL
jgi:hypothetical protein